MTASNITVARAKYEIMYMRQQARRIVSKLQ
jgi:hypothetical protein